MGKIERIDISTGITWIGISEAGVFICCGCPADVVKHMKKAGLIKKTKTAQVGSETGPNALLLSDALLQNGQVSNLTEFPVMQMLYQQGMKNPVGKNGQKSRPMLIGLEEHINSQIQYIHRGNYGLVSKEEILAAGVDEAMAEKIYAIKKFFGNGQISSPEDIFDKCIVKGARAEIKNGVFIERLSFNTYKIQYGGESETVDLNLGADEHYQPPFQLHFVDIPWEYFTVVHSGEGNGWDTERPCMASIIVYRDKVFLVDAGPNILNNLLHLGISPFEIEGVFLTHIHDDHFAGLSELVKTDRRLKFYSSRMVRETAQKKLAALMDFPEKAFHYAFDCHDLTLGQWNDLSGLQVKPVFSPHPVEANAFFFKVEHAGEEKIYAHVADVISMDTFGKIIEKYGAGVFSADESKRLKAAYTEYADLKKIDIGGGVVHGRLQDFDDDKSAKIILSHTENLEVIPKSRRNQTVRFGDADVLVRDASFSFYSGKALEYLHDYFHELSASQLQPFLDLPQRRFAPGEEILPKIQGSKMLALVLSGIVEGITDDGVKRQFPAGTIIGYSGDYFHWPVPEKFIALSFVHALMIEEAWLKSYLKGHQPAPLSGSALSEVRFLLNTPLFGNTVSLAVLNNIRAALVQEKFVKNQQWKISGLSDLYIIKVGEVRISYRGKEIFALRKNDCFGGALHISPAGMDYDVTVEKGSVVFRVPETVLLQVPNMLWKVLEVNGKRGFLCSLSK